MDELREESKLAGKAGDLALFEEYFRLAWQIAERRRSLGLSQKTLADRTGLHQSEISRLEQGEGNPTVRTLSVIATALDGRIGIVFAPQRRTSKHRSARRKK